MRTAAIILGGILLTACSTFRSPPPTSFIVFFRAESAELPAEANKTIDQAASAIKGTKTKTVAIASGVARGDNLKLAEPRFAAVSKALQGRGIPLDIIARASLPDASAKVAPNGYQRVEIILGSR